MCGLARGPLRYWPERAASDRARARDSQAIVESSASGACDGPVPRRVAPQTRILRADRSHSLVPVTTGPSFPGFLPGHGGPLGD